LSGDSFFSKNTVLIAIYFCSCTLFVADN